MVRAGSVLDFDVRGTTTLTWWGITFTTAQLRAEVVNYLSKDIDVIDVRITSPDTIITGVLPYQYSATVRVRTRIDHAQSSDVGSIVAHAFYLAGGSLPTVTYKGGALGADPLPGEIGLNLPSLPLTTTIGLAAVALILLAWKFK